MNGANTARLCALVAVVVGGSLLHEERATGWLLVLIGVIALVLIPDRPKQRRGGRTRRYGSADSSDDGWDSDDGGDGSDGGGDGGD